MSSYAETEAAARPSGLLAPLAGVTVFALLLAFGGKLLRDPDTYWQIAIGQWMATHGAVPYVDPFSWTMAGAPWISTQWLAQLALAASYAVAGWAGPVLLTAACFGLAVALLARFVGRRLPETATFVLLTLALALTLPHLVARPHVLAMPVLVAFVGGLVAAMDRGGAPRFALLGLMTLWANLHGGFVFGLALIALIGLEAILRADVSDRPTVALRWALFGVGALVASCITPYGWESLLAARRILNLGAALALIAEWQPANFSRPGALEWTVLGGVALLLWRGVTLTPLRALLVVGLLYMALSHVRNAEVLALLAPLVLAQPLGIRIGGAVALPDGLLPSRQARLAIGGALAVGTLAILAGHRYAPDANATPQAAVAALKSRGVTHVLNDYDFGGYLISQGVAPYIDGRTELYGEAMMVAHNNFAFALKPDDFFAFVADPRVEATLLRKDTPAAALLDHLDGWTRIHSDDLAVVHLRRAGATAAERPALRASVE